MARCSILAALLAVCALALPARAGEKLSKHYPGKLTFSESGLPARCSADDVWRIESFDVSFGKDFRLQSGPATAALGVHEGHVLWALVTPDEPAAIETIQLGDGERARSIFLRFAPTEVDRVFPAKTVFERGPGFARGEAARAARHKLGWKWTTGAGFSTIVPRGFVIVDVDTLEGTRRFYALDQNAHTFTYVEEFERKPLPPSPAVDPETAVAGFDEAYEAFTQGYAGFVLLPDLDWVGLGQRYRDQAAQVHTLYELGLVISDLLAHLEDLHVSVQVGEEFVPGYTRPRPLNGNWKATGTLANATQTSGEDLRWGITEDGIGYLGVNGLNDAGLVERVDEVLERMGDTWAMVVDVRFNGGGSEILAQGIAGRFAEATHVYSRRQNRNGPALDDLGPRQEHTFAPRGPWRYTAPVVLLQGRRTLSSAESMVAMFRELPQATTMGDWTGGSSGGPMPIELACGITVKRPRWVDRTPDGEPFEHVGIAPQKRVEAEPKDFDDEHDPVLEAALKQLRKLGKGKRKPARAN